MDFMFNEDCRIGQTIYNNVENPVVKCLRLKGEEAIRALQQHLESGLEFDDSCYGLMLACFLGKYDFVETLVKFYRKKQTTETYVWESPQFGRRRSLLNCYNDVGNTPLISAICGGHLDICRLLVAEGADVNLPHQMSLQTPLITAIEHRHDDIVKLLLDNDADVQQCDNVGITPLYTAIKANNECVVLWLLDADCDIEIGSQDHAPLFLATRLGQLNMVQVLIEAGCKKNIRNKYDVTPVYEAALRGHTAVLKYLLEVESIPDIIDMYQQSPLHVAVLSAHLPCVKLLVQGGANVKLRNHNRDSAMDLSLQMGKAEILEYFLEEGIDVLPRHTDPCSMKNIIAVFEQGHTATLEVMLRGFARLPMLNCISAVPIFRNKIQLMKLLMHSGIQTIPFTLLAPDKHECKEVSDWLKQFQATPRKLKDICRLEVRRRLGNRVLYSAKQLPVPNQIKQYITLRIL